MDISFTLFTFPCIQIFIEGNVLRKISHMQCNTAFTWGTIDKNIGYELWIHDQKKQLDK